MLNIRNLTIRFGDKTIINNLSFSVNAGEFVSIIGKSGRGKSVLLQAIMGNIPHEGTIKIDGKSHAEYLKITKFGIAYQDFYILPWLTIRDNIKLADVNEDAFHTVCKVMNLHDHLDVLARHTSIGTRQRASIARAILTKSDVSLMDEPLSSVDYLTARDIRHELKLFNGFKTILNVTHNLDEAIELSNKILCLGKKPILLENKNLTITDLLQHI